MVVLLSGQGTTDGSGKTGCVTAPTAPSLELVYRLEAGRERVTPRTRNKAMDIVCKRLQTIGRISGQVSALGEERIRVVLPQTENLHRVAAQIGVTSPVYLYDWEPNLIGTEKAIGGIPGQQPPIPAFKKAQAEWKAAGRNVFDGSENLQLIHSGAFPTAYDAALLAAKQHPVSHCSACSTDRPRFYLFERKAPHELIAGPEDTKKGLYVNSTGQERSRNGIVVKVPAGTVLVSEKPTDRSGKTDLTAQPGWYALRDRPALSGAEITEPEQNFDQLDQPNVTFGFTKKGRKAFQEVTRRIAQLGRAHAVGPVSVENAAAISGHFAVVLYNEVETRPIINFVEFPDGIEGRTGAEISGDFNNIGDAQELATILKIGVLPINMALIGQELLR